MPHEIPGVFMKKIFLLVLFINYAFMPLFAADSPAIHQAIRAGDLGKVKEILTADPAQLNLPDPSKNDRAPLLAAVASRYKNIVSFLIDQGADVNMMHKGKGICPLEMAALIGDTSMAALLIEKGAKVNGPTKDPGGTTPLMNAIDSGNYALVKLLVEKGADVNLKAANDTISFTWSDYFSHLLENGLDFNVKMRKGITPLEVAQENKDRIVNFLIEKGAK